MEMDISQLPYELQFQFLLGMPPQDILNYCASNQAAYQICQSYDFWDLKAKQDFGLSIDLLQETPLSPERKYTVISNVYRDNPGRLIPSVLQSKDQRILPDLIRRSYPLQAHRDEDTELLVSDEERTPLLMELVRAGPEVVKILLSHNSDPLMQREIYILSDMMNRPDVRNLVTYNPREDPSIDVRYFEALQEGEVELVKYLEQFVDIDPVDAVYIAYTTNNESSIDYIRRLYQQQLSDQDFLYHLIIMAMGYNDLLSLQRIMHDYGSNLDLDVLIEIARLNNRPELEQYLRELRETQVRNDL